MPGRRFIHFSYGQRVKVKPGATKRLLLKRYRSEKTQYGGRAARASLQKAVREYGHVPISATHGIRVVASDAPGGPSNMGGGSGMTTVHAHLRLGRPVRQHQRHLGPTAKGLLGYYREKKGNSSFARHLTRARAGALARDYGPLFFKGVGRNPTGMKARRVLRSGAGAIARENSGMLKIAEPFARKTYYFLGRGRSYYGKKR